METLKNWAKKALRFSMSAALQKGLVRFGIAVLVFHTAIFLVGTIMVLFGYGDDLLQAQSDALLPRAPLIAAATLFYAVLRVTDDQTAKIDI